ncbi:hypothetical protein Scep_029958 [Stephania cephalantha]|uniref:Uncharacterized protein n=1 Tax=Stephania cephalantha TaxID=152367 RepID=A0AAP0HG37_9MAGN
MPCTIGKVEIQIAMYDLRASIDFMSLSIYEALKTDYLRILKLSYIWKTGLSFISVGVLEDVLVKVSEVIFPADFYIVDMNNRPYHHFSSVLLGRPFLKIVWTNINVHSGSLTIEFDGELIMVNIYNVMRHPSDSLSLLLALDNVDSLVQDAFLMKGDDMKVVLENHLDTDFLRKQSITLDTEIGELILELDSAPLFTPTLTYLDLPASNSMLLSSMERPPILELKPLPNQLK